MTLTHQDPYCGGCGRPADAHGEKDQRCPEQAAGMFATYRPAQSQAGPAAVCWEHQAGELPIRLSFSVLVF